jgi:hypothetical protein
LKNSILFILFVAFCCGSCSGKNESQKHQEEREADKYYYHLKEEEVQRVGQDLGERHNAIYDWQENLPRFDFISTPFHKLQFDDKALEEFALISPREYVHAIRTIFLKNKARPFVFSWLQFDNIEFFDDTAIITFNENRGFLQEESSLTMAPRFSGIDVRLVLKSVEIPKLLKNYLSITLKEEQAKRKTTEQNLFMSKDAWKKQFYLGGDWGVVAHISDIVMHETLHMEGAILEGDIPSTTFTLYLIGDLVDAQNIGEINQHGD